MKKRTCCLLLVFVFCLVLCVSVAAAEQTGAQLSYVTDAAGLLSENENMLLEKMAESVSQKYGVGVYIVTVEDYRDFHSEGVYKATYTIYHQYTMGFDAVMMTMRSRQTLSRPPATAMRPRSLPRPVRRTATRTTSAPSAATATAITMSTLPVISTRTP